ncbi:MAG: hypothetical protein AAF465_09565 [Pseudomonadota bacterium]
MNDREFLRAIDALCQTDDTPLEPLGAAILLATAMDITDNSRSFARKFGVAHSLAIRACRSLAVDHGLLQITDTDPRTQRVTYQLTARGSNLAKQER